MRLLPVWIVALLLVLPDPAARAGTAGRLAGRVVDEHGAVLAGVAVAATSSAQIGGTQVRRTDSRGAFLYPRLTPGTYTVRLALDGFATREVAGVEVRLDRLTEIHVTLPRAQLDDQVVVTEETPVIDPARVSTGQSFTAEYLREAALGSGVRWSYQEILTQAPGVAATGRYQGAPAIRVLGSTPNENAFLIDGLETTNAYWGTPQTMIPFDAIREISLESAGFEAEYGRATGGVVNALTRSGGNTLTATLDVRFQDDALATSGDHFPNDEPFGGLMATATVGGRLLLDRVWYFAALESIDWENTPVGSPTTFEIDNRRGFVKVTGQAGPSWLGVGKLQQNPIEWRNVYAGPFVAADAQGRWNFDEGIFQAEVSGVLSQSLLWELQAGLKSVSEDYRPMNGDSSAISHLNLDTGIWSGNEAEQFARDAGRGQVGSSLSWLLEDARGSHELEIGADYQHTDLDLQGCYTGIAGGGWCTAGGEGFLFYDLADGDGTSLPLAMVVRRAPGSQRVEGFAPALYVQDAWRVLPEVTLKLGLRWDRASYDDAAGREVASLEMLQPRLGVAWDVRGDGRNVARASWGRFMHSSFLRLPRLATTDPDVYETWLSCSFSGLPDSGACRAVAAGAGLLWRTDLEGWDTGGWYLDSVTGSDPTTVAPGLEPTHADELSLGFERQLLRRTSLGLGYVDKRTRDVFDDTCAGNYPVPTPGADCSGWIVANIDAARRDYRAWIVSFETRALDRLHLRASYVNSDSKGSIATGNLTSGDFDHYPFHFDHRYGYLPDHQRHRLKVSGYVLLPWDLSFAFDGAWGSPWTWQPIEYGVEGLALGAGGVYVEPRGSREGASTSGLDVQLTKALELGDVRLRLIGTVYNLLDSERVEQVCTQAAGCGALELGEAIAWQRPRSYELGLRVEL